MLIVDGHEDLAYNVLVDGRNYLASAHATRAAEVGGSVPEGNGICMLGLPEWLNGGVGIVFATLTAIPRERANHGEPGYPNAESAHQLALAQLSIYRRWAETQPQITLITHRQHLETVVASWDEHRPGARDRRQVGLVLLIENADIVRQPDEVAFWFDQGVRLIGPAWHTNRYTGSSLDSGALTDEGRALLTAMDRHGMILDVSHMADEAIAEALDRYVRPIVATHANPRRLVAMQRQLSDAVIRRIAERDGVIGIMPVNWALDPDWHQHRTKARVHLDAVVDAIDIVRELTGGVDQIGVGTDFDGGQGAECAPAELDTIADLPKLADALTRRGYGANDVDAIMGGNWLRLLRTHLRTDDTLTGAR